jgi:hypothetical protein
VFGTVIYAGTCQGTATCPNTNRAYDPDGGALEVAYDGISRQTNSFASPRLHNGARVYLRVVNGTSKMPDGRTSRVLAATIPKRNKVIPILGHVSAAYMAAPRWAKDESFISYNTLEWSSSGSATGSYHKVPVSWSADGTPAFGSVQTIMTANALPTGGSVTKPFSGHDWSPDGEDLMYREEILQSSGSHQFALRVLADGLVTTLYLGDYFSWPYWSADGRWILYAQGGAIQMVKPDGSDQASIPLEMDDGAGLAGSPSGTEVAFGRTRPGGAGLGLFVLSLDDERVREVTDPGQTITGIFGWSSLSDVR